MFNRDWRADKRALGVSVVTAVTFAAGVGLAAGESLAAALPSVRAHVHDGVLQITGTPGGDKVALSLKAGNPDALNVDIGDDGTVDFSFDRSTFSAINVRGGAGDDAIRIDESGGAFSDDAVTLSGGPGNDTLTGGSGADVIDGGAGDDVLRGGDGDDVLNGGSGNDHVDGGRGEDNASLGTGDDRFTWDPGDGSDAVDGGSGHDTLVFNGSNVSEHMDLSADSSHVRLFRDVGNVTMDLSTIETADINATGGDDTITVNDLTGTGLQTAALDLGATPGGAGDGQPDTIIANGTDHADHVRVSSTTTGNVLISGLAPQIQVAGSEPANDTLNINTLAGNDTASVASDVSGLIQPIIDLGTDE